MKCDIYRSEKKEGMYLYVPHPDECAADAPRGVAVLPAGLQMAFGRATWVMTLEITESRQLARASGQQVLQSITDKGYFLQLPPEGLINPHAVAPEGLRGA